MKNLFISLSICLGVMGPAAWGQDLYAKAFGDPAQPAIIFLHGGPGYHAAVFELTTAENLAEAGFYVIVYDRRGEGRSTDPDAAFTFEQSVADLMSLYETYGLTTAHLLGHSFGGVLATKFAMAQPSHVTSILLVGAPVQFQASFQTIIDSSRKMYEDGDNETGLFQLDMLEAMDSSSLYYSSGCFMHAMQNGFYTVKEPTAKAVERYAQFERDSMLQTYASQMTQQAPFGFWQHHQYTTLDITPELKAIQEKGVAIFGVYGAEDGLYGKEELAHLSGLLPTERFMVLEQCSHNVFLDRQTVFIQALKDWLLLD